MGLQFNLTVHLFRPGEQGRPELKHSTHFYIESNKLMKASSVGNRAARIEARAMFGLPALAHIASSVRERGG